MLTATEAHGSTAIRPLALIPPETACTDKEPLQPREIRAALLMKLGKLEGSVRHNGMAPKSALERVVQADLRRLQERS